MNNSTIKLNPKKTIGINVFQYSIIENYLNNNVDKYESGEAFFIETRSLEQCVIQAKCAFQVY